MGLEQNPDRRLKKYFPLFAFIAVAAVSLAMAAFAYIASEDASRIKFEATADDALNRVESRINLHLALLRAGDAYFTTRGPDVSVGEFKEYFQTLEVGNNFEGLRGIGLLAMAKPAEVPGLENRIKQLFGLDRAIFPPSQEDWRAPVMLFEPLEMPAMRVIGYDMFTDTARRSAILAAIETGEPRATGRLELGLAAETNAGFIIFSAVEPNHSGHPWGVIYAAFRSRDLFRTIFDKFPSLPVSATVYDGSIEDGGLLFQSEKQPSPDMNLSATRQLLVAGRPWTIMFRPTAEFSRPSSLVVPVILGVLGLLLAFAIAMMQRYQTRAIQAAAEVQEAAEKNLVDKDLMLQEMKHRIKNSITRVLAIARQTAAGSRDMAEFSSSFAARLQAMAASQDMLTRSRWQKADLEELLRTELSQAFGKELPEGMLRGPRVMLSETATQALGLTFHELATNALKYGEVGSSPDALNVEWALKDRGRILALDWREATSEPVKAPEKAGFGTKLIDLNVTRELKGMIRRDYGRSGLHVAIELPL